MHSDKPASKANKAYFIIPNELLSYSYTNKIMLFWIYAQDRKSIKHFKSSWLNLCFVCVCVLYSLAYNKSKIKL